MANEVKAVWRTYPKIQNTVPNYLAGVVDADGTVLFGTGFSVEHRGTGQYRITPNSGMYGDYQVFVQQVFFNSDPIANAVRIVNGDEQEIDNGTGYFGVRTTVGGGFDGDRPFNFIVMRAPHLVPAYSRDGNHGSDDPYYGACVFDSNAGVSAFTPPAPEDKAIGQMLFNQDLPSDASRRTGMSLSSIVRDTPGSMEFDCTSPWSKGVFNPNHIEPTAADDPKEEQHTCLIATPIEPVLAHSRISSVATLKADYSGLAHSAGNTGHDELRFRGGARTCWIGWPFEAKTTAFAMAVITSIGPNDWFKDYGWSWGTYLTRAGAGGPRVTFSKWKDDPAYQHIQILTATFGDEYDEPPVVILTPHTTLTLDDDGDAAQWRPVLLEVTTKGFKVGGADADGNGAPLDFSYLVVPAREVS